MCLAMKKATFSSTRTPSFSAFLRQDRHAHLELGRLDRDREAPAEARDQPLLDAGHLLREAVAGDRDLLVRLEERVERIEELFLERDLPTKNCTSSMRKRSSER
jgi:hypothetical protein